MNTMNVKMPHDLEHGGPMEIEMRSYAILSVCCIYIVMLTLTWCLYSSRFASLQMNEGREVT